MKVYIVSAFNYIANQNLVLKVFDSEDAARRFTTYWNDDTKREYEWGCANWFEKEIYSDF